MRTTRTWTVSLPPNLIREAERTANEEDRTKSELVREAVRVVLDTNVLLSALAFSGGKPDQVLKRVRGGEADLFVSSFILGEPERILCAMLRYTKRETDDRVRAIRRMATLVTGDKQHLLPLRSIGGTLIVTPAGFLELAETDTR